MLDPTPPFKSLLDPEYARQEARQIIDVACPLLRELVNFATHSFNDCQQGATTLGVDEAWGPLRLYYQIIEMIDAVEVLLRESCVHPAMGPLRSAYEAGLYLTFIHYHDDFREASLAWFIGQVRQRITSLERKDPTAAAKAGEVIGITEADLRLYKEVQQKIAVYHKELQRPDLQALALRVKNAKWYQALNAGDNLFDLSKTLDALEEERATREGLPVMKIWLRAYKFLKSQYDEVLHGGDFDRWATHNDAGAVVFTRIRDGGSARQVASNAANVILQATRLSVHRFRPDRDAHLQKWYVEKIQQRYVPLAINKM